MIEFSVNQALCERIAARQPYPLLFVTVSGAHLYGFASADSDYDLRGIHTLPAREVLGLSATRDTIESEGIEDGVEIDLVTHDAAKFFGLMLKRNGYVLEQLFSPLIIRTSPEHDELKALGEQCITRHHWNHYRGFLHTQWGLFLKESPPRVKPLLYCYRVVLTGIYLMRTGRVEANLRVLNQEFKLPYIDDLIARKAGGAEQGTLADADMEFHTREKQRLEAELEIAAAQASLPKETGAKAGLNDLLLRLRGVV